MNYGDYGPLEPQSSQTGHRKAKANFSSNLAQPRLLSSKSREGRRCNNTCNSASLPRTQNLTQEDLPNQARLCQQHQGSLWRPKLSANGRQQEPMSLQGQEVDGPCLATSLATRVQGSLLQTTLHLIHLPKGGATKAPGKHKHRLVVSCPVACFILSLSDLSSL